MRPGQCTSSSPWVQCAASGLAVFAWVVRQSPEPGARLFDLQRNGLDVFDAFVVAWLFGQLAVPVHHVLPGIGRD
ncbi:hypothetical protein FJ414_28830 [Mesorhizobium sp. B3-1-6]|uniref:hypothetical protein n=1 Tax=Mesorhizobium sp. B3-1-6 TaxID=2589895 RepID=UPI00112BCFC9|nr:hypothetical protein [Mesorhizobium sp. B3-1-6]TPI27441.1 hypothetical protein FJ414_28830 [Mesorhizobium sp. B3-1-6]